MKTLLTAVAALAAFTSASNAFAKDTATGHYEWQKRPIFGPNKSNLPSRVRVWVNDATAIAGCDCAMMKDGAMAADCMAMPHKGAKPVQG